jgi:hypothetical protein
MDISLQCVHNSMPIVHPDSKRSIIEISIKIAYFYKMHVIQIILK